MKIFVSSRSFGVQCNEAVDIIKEVAEVERSTFGRPLTESDLVKVLSPYDGIIVGVDEITERAIEASDRLKIVAKHGAGVDNIDLDACTRKGIIVTYVPGANAESVADFTFCLMLALARRIISAHISTKAGNWESKKFMGTELHKKTIGIIGMGNIGSRVARRAEGFDMRVLCATAHPEKHSEEGKKYGIEFVDLSALLKESDVVTIHCALTPHTKGLISTKELALMKESALLINTARGPIVDEKAVYHALREKKIAGAAFDVYSVEPPGASCKLFELDNVIVTPHIASYTIDAIRNVDLIQARDIARVLRGELPEFVANPEVLRMFTR
jgi:D-3-phosphoglycerate dehydrogenase